MITWFKNLFADRTFGIARDSRWPKLIDWYFGRNTLCEICGKRGKEIHHIIPVHIDSSKELTSENLITLCRRHHFEWGHFFSWHSYNKDIRADINKIKNRP